MVKEKFEEDYYFLKWNTEDLIKAQTDMKILIELYNNDKKITDLDFLESVQGYKNSFQDFYETFDMLIDETFPE